MDEYTKDVSEQWLGKHVPVATQQVLNKSLLDYNNGWAVFSTWSVPRYKKRTRSVDGSVLESVKKGSEPEAEE
jgi:hypothetical protein